MGYGSSSPSSSNLSALAPPFTVDRSIPKPVVDLTDTAYGIAFDHSSHDWLGPQPPTPSPDHFSSTNMKEFESAAPSSNGYRFSLLTLLHIPKFQRTLLKLNHITLPIIQMQLPVVVRRRFLTVVVMICCLRLKLLRLIFQYMSILHLTGLGRGRALRNGSMLDLHNLMRVSTLRRIISIKVYLPFYAFITEYPSEKFQLALFSYACFRQYKFLSCVHFFC